MFRSDTLSLILIIGFGIILAYNASFLKNRRLFRLSILQILYLFVAPGIIFVIIYSYIRSITRLPLVDHPLLPDTFLINTILLAELYTYGANAIHSAAKSLSDTSLRHDDTDAAKLNKFLHLNFSHNVMMGGVFLIVAGLVLLELNHVPAYEYNRLYSPVLRGLFLGVIFISAMIRYTRSEDNYTGRWADLKAVFLVAWIALILIAYTIVRNDTPLKEYLLVFPSLLGFSLVNIVNIGLVFRHFRRRKHPVTTTSHFP